MRLHAVLHGLAAAACATTHSMNARNVPTNSAMHSRHETMQQVLILGTFVNAVFALLM
jgi:hypothetical protein